jgi:glucose/arabinose dehydrogenase
MFHRAVSSRRTAIVLSPLLAALAARAQYDCAGVSPTANTTLSGVAVATGLVQPLYVTSPPGDTGRIFIVERAGRIRIHKRGQPATTLTTFLDITSKVASSPSSEMGLLSVAFDPSYSSTGLFWVDYTETVSGQIYTVVARYAVGGANPDAADPASEMRVLRFLQAGSSHNGGLLTFGPDGFLYVFSGDGGGDLNTTCGTSQDRTLLLGKILRIDVRGVDPAATAPDCGLAGATYGVPSTNPFRDGPGTGMCDEIWSYGFRNPWRASFDAGNGDLYIADVGQSCWEEIDWVPAGAGGGQNLGWRVMEGGHCYNPNQSGTCDPAGFICGGVPACNDPSLTQPVYQYDHSQGACAITGGYVYRGCRMTGFHGTYFFGDYCAGFVKTLTMAGGALTGPQDVTSQVDPGGTLSGALSSFGVDAQGEEYAVSLNGSVRKIVPPFADLEVSATGAAAPFLLSKTGDWTWEDLFLASEEPVSFYRVYRGAPGGAYNCIFKATTPKWALGGDAASPGPGQLFAYVVTAVNASGAESRTGASGTFNGSTCP